MKLRRLFVLLITISLFVLVGCNSSSAAKSYGPDLKEVADMMLENAAEAEDVLNKYIDVWRFSIENRSAIPVDAMVNETGFSHDVIEKYFHINAAGNIPNDFSLNVHSLVDYYKDTGKLEEIENTAKEIKSKISELNNPPDEFKKAYDEALDMYSFSEEYVEMALNPSGSLQTFSEKKSQLTSDIISKHKRIEVLMPSKE